jgi:chromate reductase, NAD(P)H dehydrogenase (quinone)
MTRKVLVLVGSLRAASLNRKLAEAFAERAGDKFSFDYADLGAMPFYNDDVQAAGAPASWTHFREQVKAADALLVVTPEYNRSMPGALKNAIDVGSRPWGHNVFNGKPTMLITSSMGPIGGFGASQHVRQSLSVLGAHILAQPETYVSHVQNWFDEAGAVKDDAAKAFLAKLVDAFGKWVERFAAA